MRRTMSLQLLLLWLGATALQANSGAAQDSQHASNADVHTVFLTDCTPYSDWQSLGMIFSWKESGQVRVQAPQPTSK